MAYERAKSRATLKFSPERVELPPTERRKSGNEACLEKGKSLVQCWTCRV